MGDLISRSESIRMLKAMTNIEVIREGIETAIAIIETQEDAKNVDAEQVKRARWTEMPDLWEEG